MAMRAAAATPREDGEGATSTRGQSGDRAARHLVAALVAALGAGPDEGRLGQGLGGDVVPEGHQCRPDELVVIEVPRRVVVMVSHRGPPCR
uniref:Uncharacterized protein n=1 Tax=Janibacter limosus TaxID=53458 RepID=A0AC61U230_9MICO|nr:hypothetical protein [Janibacter limosus]